MKKAKITDFLQDNANANAGTERGLRMLDDSIASVGLGRSIVVDKHNRIIAGNKTQERAIDRGLEDAIVIETNGDKLVVVKRNDLDLADADPNNPARKLAYYDNRAAELDLSWDTEQLIADMQAGMDLSPFFDMPSLDDLMQVETDSLLNDNAQGNADDLHQLTRRDVPDAIFPSDNEFGIPTLELDRQAKFLDMPYTRWGKVSRKLAMRGTYHFYTEDYKFSALWDDPSDIINSQCLNIVEPNFSTNPQMPRAVVLWGIYRKRWLARYWQSYGINVIVDLNMELDFASDMLLGVPDTWGTYAVRAADSDESFLDAVYEIACTKAQSKPHLFLVYAGGKSAKAWADKHGALWIREDAQESERAKYGTG